MNEIFVDIVEYEGLYQVSTLGRVKSFHNRKERILKQVKTKDGYLRVDLWKDGKHHWKLVHRLVAEAFIGNPNGDYEINHKDFNPSNNHVENIEYCDRQYNIDYSKSKAVLQYSFDGKIVNEFKSTSEAARQLGFKQSNICACCNNKPKYKTAYGFIWRYKNDEQN